TPVLNLTRSTRRPSEGLIRAMPDPASVAGVLVPSSRRHLGNRHPVEDGLARRVKTWASKRRWLVKSSPQPAHSFSGFKCSLLGVRPSGPLRETTGSLEKGTTTAWRPADGLGEEAVDAGGLAKSPCCFRTSEGGRFPSQGRPALVSLVPSSG